MTDFSARYVGKGQPANLSAIEQRLRNISKDSGAEVRRMRHSVAIAVLCDVMEGIALSESDERLLIKGGTAMRLRFGLSRARFSKDLDAMLRGQIEPYLERLRERGREPHHGWTFVIAKEEDIEVPGMVTKPRRAQVKLSYRGKSFSTIQLEIAPEEGSSADEHDLATSEDLRALGFEADVTPRQMMSVRYQAAQKFHACTSKHPEGKPNVRSHDLVDLILLENFIREDLHRAREACENIFTGRASTIWPPTVEPEEGWTDQYARDRDGLDEVTPDTLQEAVDRVNALIADIDAAGTTSTARTISSSSGGSQDRVPPGVPSGGQLTERRRGEADVHLTESDADL